ncbi:hypothetical protein [Agrobacterium tumefaciens]|uniref:hypothetical protein n=1 Tax=Agrobacterium tumefaciens TaxID=358 RepID=UPI001F33455C|nr:hypothetical protein [Agrobacterium tumefaciens]
MRVSIGATAQGDQTAALMGALPSVDGTSINRKPAAVAAPVPERTEIRRRQHTTRNRIRNSRIENMERKAGHQPALPET